MVILASQLSRLDHPPAIIITSAYEQYAIQAFQTIAAGYLLKPVQQEQLQHALNKAQTLTRLHTIEAPHAANEGETTPSYRQTIACKSYRGIDRITVTDIRAFMADQKYVRLISIHGERIIDETLKNLEQEFKGVFIRVHRNAMVSLSNIQGLKRSAQGSYYLVLDGIKEQPIVSRRYVSKIKAILS